MAEPFLKILGLTNKQLAKLIAEGRPEWPQLRRMLQVMDNWDSRSPGCWNSYTNVKYLILGKPFILSDNLKTYLTGRIHELKLKEQGSREGAEGGEAD